MDEQQKREKEFKDWQDVCASAIAHASNGRPPDIYIKAKIYDRNMKSGIFQVKDVPLDKGMAALVDFTETKIQNKGNGNREEHEERIAERRRKHNMAKDKKYNEVI